LKDAQASFDLGDLDAARQSAISLQRQKLLVGATRENDFMERIQQLWLVACQNEGDNLLRGLALLFRIGAVAKHIRPRFELLASQVTYPPALTPQALPDSDDRRYLGEGLAFASGSWKVKYLAKAAIDEVSGEEAREQFVAGVVQETGTLSDSISALRDSFESWQVETQDIGVSRARRMTRVVLALKKAVVDLDPEIGDGAGSVLLAFVRSSIAGEQISDVAARIQAAEALLDFVSTVVRFHFSIASDVETYAAVGVVRRWFVSDNPPEELVPLLDAVGRQISEALIFLAKQGVSNDQLRKTLLVVMGSARGGAELDRVGSQIPGIPGELRQWLVSGKRAASRLATGDAVEETVLRTVDKDIASLLREALDLRTSLDRLEDDLPAAVAGYEPRLVPTVERLSSTARRIAQRIEMLAARRQMRFSGEAGDVVDFNPVDHELPTEELKGRTAKIKLPSVIRGIDGAPPIVILKADVEGTD